YLGVDGGAILEQFRKQSSGATRPAPARAASPLDGVPKAERLLLGCLLASAEARAEVLPRLAESEWVANLRTSNVLQALIAACGSSGELDLSQVEARLRETERPLLSALVFADGASEPDTSLAQALEW